MHVKEIYVIFIYLFDTGILDHWFKQEKRENGGGGGGEFYLWILQLNKCYVSTV